MYPYSPTTATPKHELSRDHRHANGDKEKPRRPQPYPENCRQLRNAESRKEHRATQHQTASPENIRTSKDKRGHEFERARRDYGKGLGEREGIHDISKPSYVHS